VVTAEFLDHRSRIGNDLTTPMPETAFPVTALDGDHDDGARNGTRAGVAILRAHLRHSRNG
jgi:uncharacterized protein (DUF2237 family)